MGIEIKGVICPQCGSRDVSILSDEQGQCNSCQAQFVIKAIPEIVNADQKKENDHKIAVDRLVTEYTKDEFIRECWINSLAYDTPPDLFTSSDFDEPKEIERIVFNFWGDADVTFTASSGHDRKEPYIEMEQYKEKIGNEYVTKERPVTKFKTVTDWSPFSGRTKLCELMAATQRDDGEQLDIDLYKKSSIASKRTRYTGIITPAHIITEYDIKNAKSRLAYEAEKGGKFYWRDHIPGDRVANLKLSAEEVYFKSGIVEVASEYITSLKYKDKEYRANGFPVSNMHIKGFHIHDENGVEAEIVKMRNKKNIKRWEITKKSVLLSIAALLASMIVTLLIRQYVLDFVIFAAAVGMYIYSRKYFKKVDAELEQTLNEECVKLKSDHKAYLLKALNAKLSALGYKEATPEEIDWRDKE